MPLKLHSALKGVICSATEKLFPDSLDDVSNQYAWRVKDIPFFEKDPTRFS